MTRLRKSHIFKNLSAWLRREPGYWPVRALPEVFSLTPFAAELIPGGSKLTEPNLERQQSVLKLLQQFQGTEPLKQLFWSELNYERVNTQLSRRGWTDAVAGGLADDPLLLASGANDFHVIYSRLSSDKLLMGLERPVVSKLLKDHPYSLFLFSNSKQDQFHFLNVKYDDDVQKRRLFRRITVGPNERLRTASERIALLDLADISPNLFGLRLWQFNSAMTRRSMLSQSPRSSSPNTTAFSGT